MSEFRTETEPEEIQQEPTNNTPREWEVERQTLEQALQGQKVELQKALEVIQSQKVEHAFYRKASAAGINPESVMDVVNLNGIKENEEGVFEGLDELVTILTAASRPNKPKEIGGANNPPLTKGKSNQQLLAEAAELARRSGRAEDRAAYSALKIKLSN